MLKVLSSHILNYVHGWRIVHRSQESCSFFGRSHSFHRSGGAVRPMLLQMCALRLSLPFSEQICAYISVFLKVLLDMSVPHSTLKLYVSQVFIPNLQPALLNSQIYRLVVV